MSAPGLETRSSRLAGGGVFGRARHALLVTVLASAIACGDDGGPTDPGGSPLLPDFSCEEVSDCTLTCTDRTTGGVRPYVLFWQADEQAPTSVQNPTFTWNFSGSALVRVRLSVTGEGGEGATRGPVERAFRICDNAITDAFETETVDEVVEVTAPPTSGASLRP